MLQHIVRNGIGGWSERNRKAEASEKVKGEKVWRVLSRWRRRMMGGIGTDRAWESDGTGAASRTEVVGGWNFRVRRLGRLVTSVASYRREIVGEDDIGNKDIARDKSRCNDDGLAKLAVFRWQGIPVAGGDDVVRHAVGWWYRGSDWEGYVAVRVFVFFESFG
ncbi:hypothetical protein HPP92_004670 [Vanilla planifolia]|uniref:Uncharacterized protein n=1 Tax=Vanilla planifolia TaxID=51239 RepID=A0A835VEP0_VANPL|nr:hypothetical protein HPP92_004670 [Vanilla planifolia]